MILANLPILIPLSLLVGAFLTAFLGIWRRKIAYRVTVCTVIIAFGVSVIGLRHVMVSGTVRYYLAGWFPPIGIEYVLDPLAAFLVTVILGIASLVIIHSRQNVEAELAGKVVPYYAVALLLLTGFCGILLTGDLFNLYVFLEISSLSAYALIAVGEKPSPVAAFRYLLVGTIGASFFLLGLGFIYISTGSLNIADIANILPTVVTNPPIIVGLALMIVGVSIKMALFPMHGWQPDAYTFAPSTTTALLAPIATKVAAYVMIRILFFVFDPEFTRESFPITEVITWISMGGIVFGSVMAIAQKELKRMLAYSSLAQIGYIGLGIGLANPLGFAGAILHVLNHAFMKGGLFLVAGNLRLRVGHSNISLFDNSLRKSMPWTMASFTVFALSMVGIPPLAGFFSKWYLVLGGLENDNWIAVVVILVSSLLNAIYFFRILEKVYMQNPKAEDQKSAEEIEGETREVGLEMLVPTIILAVGLFLLGFLNATIITEIITLMIPGGL